MKFYEIDGALQEAIEAADKAIRIKIEIKNNEHFEAVFEQDIIEANFYSLKEQTGGVSARGELLLDNPQGIYSYSSVGAGTEVWVSFSLGEGLPYFKRFIFYIDDNGLQDIRGAGRKRLVYIGLRDFSAVLRKTDEAKDWSAPAVFTYSVICDKTQPHKSLVHGIAGRAGLAVSDIDCSTIPVTLPFVKLSKNIWFELSSLATAYRCHLECTVEKPLVFAHSPYQSETVTENEISHTFYGYHIYYLRTKLRENYYRNTVRLKVNMPVVLERQEIWRYEDTPVLYDDLLKEYFPFRNTLTRVIEIIQYSASYMIRTMTGKTKNIVYADEIDTKEEAEARLQFEGGNFHYAHYDVTSNYDKAVITLKTNTDGDLYKAVIFGRPIVIDQNRSCFMRNDVGVSLKGTRALNVTGKYFSEYEVMGKNGTMSQFEDWVERELVERLRYKREITVKTHRALFHARVGAKVKVVMRDEEITGSINAFTLRYKRDRAFVASFKIYE